MSKMRDLVTDILADIDEGEMTFSEIAIKHGVSLREVNDLAMESAEEAAFYHDEMERDHDERYEYDDCYPDPDAEYESRYELEDF